MIEPEGECIGQINALSVNLADAFAFGFNHYLFLQDFVLNPLGEIAFTPLAAGQHGLHLFRGDLPTFAERRRFA